MQTLFRPDPHGEHVIVTTTECGDNHSTRATAIRVPEGMNVGNIGSIVEAADALALIVQCQLENMNSADQAYAKQVLARYGNLR